MSKENEENVTNATIVRAVCHAEFMLTYLELLKYRPLEVDVITFPAGNVITFWTRI